LYSLCYTDVTSAVEIASLNGLRICLYTLSSIVNEWWSERLPVKSVHLPCQTWPGIEPQSILCDTYRCINWWNQIFAARSPAA